MVYSSKDTALNLRVIHGMHNANRQRMDGLHFRVVLELNPIEPCPAEVFSKSSLQQNVGTQVDITYHVRISIITVMSPFDVVHRTHLHTLNDLETKNNSPGGKMILRDSMESGLFCRGVAGCYGFGLGGTGCCHVCVLRFGNTCFV